ncbi:hypothetical protein FDG2_2457 [Candidatus Protofrankia californiensis]|uniref:Uncharacterized protein n=1 Tax=Candidatus Protofrankia californiensis TaxID=1839754 RepID=A0A1C3NXP9_9ACTN|nr:hypothetical protein FDG2_2457 [Candidatus Protofrankia californiensis]
MSCTGWRGWRVGAVGSECFSSTMCDMKNSIRRTGRHARQTGRTGDVLLLAPSLGLGGGIERYLATLEQALDGSGAQVRRVDLLSPGRRPTLAVKAAFTARP